jgi:acyl dehydratase
MTSIAFVAFSDSPKAGHATQPPCSASRGLGVKRARARRVTPARREVAVRVYPRERFSSEVTLTPSMVGAYANAAGDDNPVHRDAEFAASTRYGRLIASGTHTTALLLGLTASHFSKKGAMVGLEFWVRFRRPIYADETILLEWLVVKVTPNDKLKW